MCGHLSKMSQTFEFLKKSVFGLAQGPFFLMAFQVLPVSGRVGNAIRISCLEPGNVEGIGNKNELRTQSKTK